MKPIPEYPELKSAELDVDFSNDGTDNEDVNTKGESKSRESSHRSSCTASRARKAKRLDKMKDYNK